MEISAINGQGIDDLSVLLRGKVAAFCGNSGVGKTSLLRRLLNDENYGRVGAVNVSSGKGRHTTSGAVLLEGPGGSGLIDTPDSGRLAEVWFMGIHAGDTPETNQQAKLALEWAEEWLTRMRAAFSPTATDAPGVPLANRSRDGQ